MGGSSEAISTHLAGNWHEGLDLAAGLKLAITALAQAPERGAAPTAEGQREIALDQLEVALLQRDRPRRTFRRLTPERLHELASG
jgi:proteasome alpha subunit